MIGVLGLPLVAYLLFVGSSLFHPMSNPANKVHRVDTLPHSIAHEVAAADLSPLLAVADLTPPMAQALTPSGTMPSWLPKPLPVDIIIYANSIDQINEAEGIYIASIDFTQTWQDSHLAFDPHVYGTFQRELSFQQADELLTKIWTPKIEIGNLRGRPISREPCLLIDLHGNVTYTQRIDAVFTMKYNLKPFPFDTQPLLIQLVSNHYDTSQIEFTQSQLDLYKSGIRSTCAISGWTVHDLSYSQGNFTGLDGKFYPSFDIHINITRKAASYIFSFLPLFLIVIVPTILTLYAEVDIGARLSTWSGAILALIALSFTMQLRYPALPTNSILNQLVAVIFAYEFFMICITMTVFNPQITVKLHNPYLVPAMKGFMRWQIPVIFIAIVAFIISITIVNS